MRTNSQRLFEKLYVPIVSFIYRQIKDFDDAKDIYINVFGQNVTELDGYNSTGDLEEVIQFLEEKAQIEILNFKENKGHLREALEVYLENHDEYEGSVEDSLITIEMEELIKEARLSEQEDVAMRLYLSKLKGKEAAEIMNIKPSTYRVTLRNAIKKYKLFFKAGGFLLIVILIMICANAH